MSLLTEAAIGSGLTGMLLLRAGARAKATQPTAAPPGKLLRLAAAVLCATVAAGLASLILYRPDQHRRSRRQRLQVCRPLASATR